MIEYKAKINAKDHDWFDAIFSTELQLMKWWEAYYYKINGDKVELHFRNIRSEYIKRKLAYRLRKCRKEAKILQEKYG